VNCLPRLASNYNPPDLCLLSSKDYKREPLALSSNLLFLTCNNSKLNIRYRNFYVTEIHIGQKNLCSEHVCVCVCVIAL
jgi:hypothetical protein